MKRKNGESKDIKENKKLVKVFVKWTSAAGSKKSLGGNLEQVEDELDQTQNQQEIMITGAHSETSIICPEVTAIVVLNEQHNYPMMNRWTPEDKIRIVLESLNTNMSTSELCRKYSLPPNTFYQWRERFIEGGKVGLSGKLDEGVNKELEHENESLKKLIGEFTIGSMVLLKKYWKRERESETSPNPFPYFASDTDV